MCQIEKKRIHASVLAISFLFTPTAFSSAFLAQGQSVVTQGRGDAGGSLAADDASAAFFNPTDIVLLQENRLQAGGIYVRSRLHFDNENTNNSLLGAPGGQNADGGTESVVPNFYYIGGAGSNLRYSLAMTVPFGKHRIR